MKHTDRRPDIALYLPNLHGGGAERMMVNLSRGFAQRGANIDLVLAAAEGPYLAHVPSDVQVVDLASSGVMSSLPKFVRYLRRARPQTLLVTLNHAAVVALLAVRFAGVSTRVFVRESNMMFPGDVKSLKARTLRFSVKRFYPWATGHIGVSEGVSKDLQRFVSISPEKVHTIYNPVVTDDLERQAQAPINHPWLGVDTPPVLLAAGRLTKQKDYPTLICAFAKVREARPARLIILGEGEQRAELEALIAALGLQENVALPGFVDNPFAYMSRASLFVLSSAWEGLPGVLIQAMACGCPVVSTNCPSGPNEILEGGKYGSLVSVGDAQGLADAALHALEHSVSPSELKARASDFSVKSISDQYLEVLLPEQTQLSRAA